MKSLLKILLKNIPLLARLEAFILKQLRKNKTIKSAEFWEQRYKKGGNSGDGSYRRLATFKAEVVNSFVKEKQVESVIDFGCGDGNQLLLSDYPKYLGLDISATAIDICKEKFEFDHTKEFLVYHPAIIKQLNKEMKSDLSLSLDVIFHLLEEDVFNQYMHDLFDSAKLYVIIYSSNFESKGYFHLKNRKFTDWVEKNKPDWILIKKIDNPYPFTEENSKNTSISDFYIFEAG